jgi:mRNA-degrading endonuclease toxin of MazEF toxin-antitoxin module
VESVEWKGREAVKLGRCPDQVMEEVRARLAALLGY